jgi:ribosomal protein S18 acetylase RimI-like enzyme
MGMRTLDDTRVMVCPDLSAVQTLSLPSGLTLQRAGHEPFAHAVGGLRGSTLAQRLAHAQRLALSPVPFEAYVVRRDDDGQIVAGGQRCIEDEFVGLYDIYTTESMRGRGIAAALCATLMVLAREAGARVAYLQVEADNDPARAVYRRLGFADAYRYHYRTADPAAR